MQKVEALLCCAATCPNLVRNAPESREGHAAGGMPAESAGTPPDGSIPCRDGDRCLRGYWDLEKVI